MVRELNLNSSSSSADESESESTEAFRTPSPDPNQTDYGIENSTYLRSKQRKPNEPPKKSDNNPRASTSDGNKKVNAPPKPPPPPPQPEASSSRKRKQVRPINRQTKAEKERAFLQKTVHALIPKAPFGRLVREILYTHGQFQVTKGCLEALHESSEMYLTQLFEDTNRCCIHRGRVTVGPKDMQLVLYLRGHRDPGVE